MERRARALEEKNYIDSLQNVVSHSVLSADSLAMIGLAHDEGYDSHLVKAKELYGKASAAIALLGEKGVEPDMKLQRSAVERCDNALRSARTELAEKAAMLEADEDPEMVAEAPAFRRRVELIDNVLK